MHNFKGHQKIGQPLKSLKEYCVTEQSRNSLKDCKYIDIDQIQMMRAALGEAITLFDEHDLREAVECGQYCRYLRMSTTKDNELCVLLCKATDMSQVKNHYIPVVKGRAGLRTKRGRETTTTTTGKCSISKLTPFENICIL